VRRASAEGGWWATFSSELWAPAREPALARLARATPEIEAIALLSDGSLGPLLALPEDWLAPPVK